MPSVDRLNEAFQWFRAGFDSERLAHAYLVVGPPRKDGMSFAESALKVLFCESKGKACGRCHGCKAVENHAHPDVLWIEPIKKSQRIVTEQITEIHKRLYQTSFTGEWKACVIIGADRINVDASNKFLKILEEPVGKTLFLLLTDSPQSILATVLSRCQRVVVSGEQDTLPDEMWQRCRMILTSPIPVLAEVWRAKQLGLFLKEIRVAIGKEEKESASEDEDEDTVEARIAARVREIRTRVMRAMLLWHRDILMCAVNGDRALLNYLDDQDARLTEQLAKGMTCSRALRNVKTVEEMQAQLDRNIPEESVFALGFARLQGN